MEATHRVSVNRDLYTHDALEAKYVREPVPKPPFSKTVKEKCTCSKRKSWKILTTFLPIIKFIRYYNFRQCLLGDFLSGLTVSFMHLPQGMGFGMLASLDPVHGLYTTFWPVLFYLFFGTSPHVSFGTNAVIALLTQTVVEREAALCQASPNTATNGSSEIEFTTMSLLSTTGIPGMGSETSTSCSPEEIFDIKVRTSMAASILVGIILGGMGILRLGFLTMYLSVSFIGGFTTAAAVHIASSQVPKMLGINVPSQSGAFRLVNMYIEMFKRIEQTIIADLVIAIVCIVVLLVVKVCINERFKSKMKIPVPIDLLVVILGTIVSHFGMLKENFQVNIVGPIPAGIPAPFVPPVDSFSRIAVDAFVMALLSFAMTISMAKLTARIHGNVVDDNQELIAYGICNVAGGFFRCFPQATAPPRTMILSCLGAKTTLNGVVTAIFMLLILLIVGQLFVSLPVAVLAAMIIVAMKDLLLQVRNIPRQWRINRYDCIIWVMTCLVSVFVDLDIGLIVGVGVSILFVVIQHQLASGYLMGIPSSEYIIVDMRQRRDVSNVPGIRIFHFEAPLYFANAERFRKQIYAKVLDPIKYKKKKLKQKAKQMTDMKDLVIDGHVNPVMRNGSQDTIVSTITSEVHNGVKSFQGEVNLEVMDNVPNHETDDEIPHHVIIDCETMCYIDLGGITSLQQVVKEYKDIGVQVCLARCPQVMMKTLEAADFFEKFDRSNIFYDIYDAVEGTKTDDGGVDGLMTKL